MKTVKGILLALAVALAGCTATTHFQTTQADVQLQVNTSEPLDLSKTHAYKTTSFGQYKFKAQQAGKEPMYGLMPLKFNGGYLVADILFFAPATFFNLREVFPYYEIDVEQNEIRYRKKPSEAWTVYRPTPREAAHAKRFFRD